MSYVVDQTTGDIVISGWDKGIGDSPYSGLTDVRNVEIITVPGEAPVNFATSSQTTKLSAISIASASGATLTLATGATGLKDGQAIYFASTGTLSGVTGATPYWVLNCLPTGNPTSVTVSSTYTTNTAVTITGSSGGATISTYNVGETPSGTLQGGPTYFAYDGTYNWCVDRVGQVWSTITPLGSAGSTWSYTGNKPPVTNFYSGTPVFSTVGNGLVFYEAIDGTGYLFVFHGGSIDYTKTASANISWQYQYNPTLGSSAGFAATPTKKLNTNIGYLGSHMAIVGQDNAIYYCDGNTVGSIVATNNGAYDPTVIATYTWHGGGNAANTGNYALQLPAIDVANCLAELGTSLLVGGQLNLIYPWNRLSTFFSFPIFLAENNVSKMITVNTNTYIFLGNRGRIYITNGSQAQVWKKIPDHLSGTIIPYFTWGGVAFNRNELYFSFSATTNGGTTISSMGGVWAVNLDTGAMRIVNKLSYGTYAGYSSAMTSVGNTLGAGLHIGWANNTLATATLFGIDSTTSTPYTAGQATVVSDMIPIGTLLKKEVPKQFEFKVSNPLQAGESVSLYAGYSMGDYIGNTMTLIGTTQGSSATGATAILSGNFPSPLAISGNQWLLVQGVLTTTSGATPSYTRLTEIRIILK